MIIVTGDTKIALAAMPDLQAAFAGGGKKSDGEPVVAAEARCCLAEIFLRSVA